MATRPDVVRSMPLKNGGEEGLYLLSHLTTKTTPKFVDFGPCACRFFVVLKLTSLKLLGRGFRGLRDTVATCFEERKLAGS